MLFNLFDNSDLARFNTKIAFLKSKGATIEVIEKKGSRTLKQNNAIHLFHEMIADTLNEMGFTFHYTGVKGFELEMRYTKGLVKECFWKPIQQTLFDKKSTTELTSEEVSEIATHIEHFFAKNGIDLPFPSIDNMK